MWEGWVLKVIQEASMHWGEKLKYKIQVANSLVFVKFLLGLNTNQTIFSNYISFYENASQWIYGDPP